MAHHVIYVPGLGDHRTYGQDMAIQLWRLFGLVPHYFPLGWATRDGFDVKLGWLLERIDSLRRQGHTVSLVGVSAGASAALAAYAARPQLVGVVCICGKIQRPERVQPITYQNNPDFEESMQRVATNLRKLQQRGQLENIMSIHPLRDRTVALEDTKIVGTTEKTIPAWSHASGIFVGVLFGAPIIAKFLHSAQSHLQKG